MEETSLSDFGAREESSPDTVDDPDSPADQTEASDDNLQAERAEVDGEEEFLERTEPPTSEWHPDGLTCADCDDSVSRVWFSDGQRVCKECKVWE